MPTHYTLDHYYLASIPIEDDSKMQLILEAIHANCPKGYYIYEALGVRPEDFAFLITIDRPVLVTKWGEENGEYTDAVPDEAEWDVCKDIRNDITNKLTEVEKTKKPNWELLHIIYCTVKEVK